MNLVYFFPCSSASTNTPSSSLLPATEGGAPEDDSGVLIAGVEEFGVAAPLVAVGVVGVAAAGAAGAEDSDCFLEGGAFAASASS